VEKSSTSDILIIESFDGFEMRKNNPPKGNEKEDEIK
jgi:hypothetical protein